MYFSGPEIYFDQNMCLNMFFCNTIHNHLPNFELYMLKNITFKHEKLI